MFYLFTGNECYQEIHILIRRSSKSAKGKAGAKGKKNQVKDDMSVKSEKISRSKSGILSPAVCFNFSTSRNFNVHNRF